MKKFIIFFIATSCLSIHPVWANKSGILEQGLMQDHDISVLSQSPPYTNFCLKERFKEENGKLYCNWGRSFAEACEDYFTESHIEKGAVVEEPTEIGSCANGNKVIRIKNN